MKKVFAFLLALACSGLIFADGYHFFTSGELNQIWGPSPGVRETPVSALVNPAYVAMQDKRYWETEMLYAIDGFSFNEPGNFGFFYANHVLNLGFLYSELPDGSNQYDYNFGFGFGNRIVSLGFTNGAYYSESSGSGEFFGNYRVGMMVRPSTFLSMGLGVGGTYDQNWTELNAELAVRPVPVMSNFLTLFGNYSTVFHRDDFEHVWSAGLMLKPVKGLQVQAAYSSLKTVTLGFSLGFSGPEIGVTFLPEQDFSAMDALSLELRYSENGKRSRIQTDSGIFVELNLKDRKQFWDSGNSLLRTLMVIDKAGNDPAVRGIVLNTSGYRGSREELWEIRKSLEVFKASGKKVIAFIDSADFDLYTLASVADKIVMDPAGMVSFLGLSVGRNYFRNTLDKLGIGVTELRYFTYKSAAETYTRSSFSDADREQYGAYLDDIFNYSRALVMKARTISDTDFDEIINREFFYSANAAKARKLVDYVGRRDELNRAIKTYDSSSYWVQVYGDRQSSLMADNSFFPEYTYQGYPRDVWGEPPHIAIVTAEGTVDMDSGMAARGLAKTIMQLAASPLVKAVVIRVNSPGGSAIAADYIDEAIKFTKARKPVVVSMGDVAGSGGYWLSMSADHIVASPYTMTGSIGVIATWFYNNGVYEKLGISTDTIQRGEHADMLSGFILPRRNLDEEEVARYREFIMQSYQDFVRKVSESRKLPLEKVESIAQGRIYSGVKAKELGLVDSTGSLWDAIGIARKLAKIPDSREIVFEEYPVMSPFASFVSGLTETIVPAQVKNPLLEELKYRVSENGSVMPIMSLDVMEQ